MQCFYVNGYCLFTSSLKRCFSLKLFQGRTWRASIFNFNLFADVWRVSCLPIYLTVTVTDHTDVYCVSKSTAVFLVTNICLPSPSRSDESFVPAFHRLCTPRPYSYVIRTVFLTCTLPHPCLHVIALLSPYVIRPGLQHGPAGCSLCRC